MPRRFSWLFSYTIRNGVDAFPEMEVIRAVGLLAYAGAAVTACRALVQVPRLFAALSRDSNFALKHLQPTQRSQSRLARTARSMPPRFTRSQSATRHKRGIQMYEGRAGFQIATLFERAA